MVVSCPGYTFGIFSGGRLSFIIGILKLNMLREDGGIFEWGIDVCFVKSR